MINPRVDIAFKKIFGVEENKDLLISLINSIVSEADQVSEVTLLNPYNPKHFQSDKLSILDIKAKAIDGTQFNIEVQITDERSYDKRALYYWAKLYTEQLQIKQSYDRLAKTIGIHILNFTSIVGVNKYHNVFHVTEKETGERFFTDLELHTIELKKFIDDDSPKDLTDLIAKISTSLDLWAAFLTRHDLLNKDQLPANLMNHRALTKALTVLEVMNFTKEERAFYEDHLKWLRMEMSALEKVRVDSEARGMEMGEARGIEIGKARGIEIGEARGIEIGEARGKSRAIEVIARNMLSKKLDHALIAQATGLPIEHIMALEDEAVCL